jgi:hypothetical protein
MEENGWSPDACAMRILHSDFASYSIFVAGFRTPAATTRTIGS